MEKLQHSFPNVCLQQFFLFIKRRLDKKKRFCQYIYSSIHFLRHLSLWIPPFDHRGSKIAETTPLVTRIVVCILFAVSEEKSSTHCSIRGQNQFVSQLSPRLLVVLKLKCVRGFSTAFLNSLLLGAIVLIGMKYEL